MGLSNVEHIGLGWYARPGGNMLGAMCGLSRLGRGGSIHAILYALAAGEIVVFCSVHASRTRIFHVRILQL